ncbi:MAG: transposase family protein, partial [Candidatus Binatia bacterium]|nr:transposase family protein [Candidatus Binatia bacterium]
MVIQRGNDHARHRALSISVGVEIAVDRSRVDLNVKGQCVEVWAEHPEGGSWACPQCSRELPLYDHAEERTWRHLDSCQYQTHLHARIPRVECGEHG